MIFGSLATLIGAYLGYRLRFNRWLVPIPTILANTLIVPLILKYGYAVDLPIWMIMVYLLAGEVIGVFILGEILASALLKHRQLFKQRTSDS